MTWDDSLLEAIRDDPGSLDLRLVYADWLEESGGAERARFVRAQCQLELLPAGDPRRHVCDREQAELLRRHQRGWLGPLWGRLRHARFRRGLLESVELTVALFLRHGDALLRLGPLPSLRLVGATPDALDLSACPHLARVRALDLSYNYLTDEAVESLAGSAHVGRLRVLSLRNNFVRRRGAEALAESPYLGELRALDLRGNRIPPEVTDALRDRYGDGLTL